MKKIIGKIKDVKGIGLVEAMFASILTVFILAAIISTWLFAYKNWDKESGRTIMRVEVNKSIEIMKSDMRLSSLTYMSFYPANSTNYTAISLPVAEADANGMLSLNDAGEIEWDETVIYHLYDDLSGNKILRRTVIDPRDNTLSEIERYDELAATAVNGEGPEGSSTDLTFLENIDNFEVTLIASEIDFYTDSETAVK
ncbi:MAG: hypothetical protein HQL29_06595, partial [Candidatus Omnitrophica bacterium]|nr:hypothetical protein [Candidatus Omnitrophota bacterium]